MAAGKWIGGFLGWMAGGPLGALAGLAIGAMFDYGLDNVNNNANSGTFAYDGTSQSESEGQRNGFLFSFLVLAAYMIRADGKVMHSEMELVRQFLRRNFGEAAVAQGETILRRLFDEQKRQGAATYRNTVADCCAQMAANMGYSERLQLLSFLAMVAKADGSVPPEEAAALKDCARWMGMADADADSMLGMGGSSLDDAYKVLGVAPTATDDEVRKAYRKLALANHPDRVAALGEDIRRAAEKKLQEINEAKERVYKARGM